MQAQASLGAMSHVRTGRTQNSSTIAQLMPDARLACPRRMSAHMSAQMSAHMSAHMLTRTAVPDDANARILGFCKLPESENFLTQKNNFSQRVVSENLCGQEARHQQLITSVWLFHAPLCNFGFGSHGESGFLSQKFF